MRTRTGFAVILAMPGVLLALSGFFHPHHLTYDTSLQWFWVHIPGLLAFPLVGVALIMLVRGRNDTMAWVIRLAGFAYATFYSALDVINGIAAGYLTHQAGGKYRGAAVPELFDIGRPIGDIGEWALLLTCVAVLVDTALRHGVGAGPALVLLPGAWFVRSDHIFSPVGVLGMTLIGLGTGYAAWVGAEGAAENRWRKNATPRRVEAS